MHKLRISLGLMASVWALSTTMPVYAAAPPAIRESVAVCDPNSPTHCAAPDSSGITPVDIVSGGGGGGAVFGPTAVGSAAANPPILQGGTVNATATGNVQVIKVDSSGNQQQNITQIGGTAVSTGTGAQGAGAQRITVATDTATVAGSASIPAGTNLMGKIGIDQTTVGTTNAVSLAQIGATAVLTGGVNGSQGIGGLAANNASASGNPLAVSGLAESAEPTLATNGQNATIALDLAHKLITSPYANKENMLRGTTAQTGTSAGTILAAGGSGLFGYLTGLQCSNTSATNIFVTLSDSAASIFIVPATGGTNITFETPLVSSATNTAITATASAGVSTLYCNGQGYKGS